MKFAPFLLALLLAITLTPLSANSLTHKAQYCLNSTTSAIITTSNVSGTNTTTGYEYTTCPHGCDTDIGACKDMNPVWTYSFTIELVLIAIAVTFLIIMWILKTHPINFLFFGLSLITIYMAIMQIGAVGEGFNNVNAIDQGSDIAVGYASTFIWVIFLVFAILIILFIINLLQAIQKQKGDGLEVI